VRYVIISSTVIKFVTSKIKMNPTQNSEILNSKSTIHSDHNSADLKGNTSLEPHDMIDNNYIDPAGRCVGGDTHMSHSGVIRGFGGYKSEVYEAMSTAFLGLGLVGGEYFNRGECGRKECYVLT
jgi:hypothetical protein